MGMIIKQLSATLYICRLGNVVFYGNTRILASCRAIKHLQACNP